MTSHGPVIGTYEERPIYDFIVYEGHKLAFAGLAVTDHHGTMDLRQLAHGQCVLPPGLLYGPAA